MDGPGKLDWANGSLSSGSLWEGPGEYKTQLRQGSLLLAQEASLLFAACVKNNEPIQKLKGFYQQKFNN